MLSVALSVLVVSLTTAILYYTRMQTAVKPSWLKSDAFMVYEQFFAWDDQNKTESMQWDLTGLSGDSVDLHLVSYGVNVTGGTVATPVGEIDWRLNVFTREITSCSDSYYVGKKCPFWIETNVKEGSLIDIIYGSGGISGSESILAFGKQRECWTVEFNWPTSSMKHWYDKSSGLCLKIHVVLHSDDITIDVTETAVQTNINLGL